MEQAQAAALDEAEMIERLRRLGVPLPEAELREIAAGRILLERWLERARRTPA